MGNAFEPRGDPIGYFTKCIREYGDIVFLRFLGVPMCLLNRPDCIESVLVTQHNNFEKSKDYRALRRVLGNGLLTSEGEFWRRQRKLVQPAFHQERIAAYTEVMVAYSERMLASWKDGQGLDVHEAMMRLTLDIVAKTLFDTDVSREAEDVGAALQFLMGKFMRQAAFAFLLPASIPIPTTRRLRRAVGQLDKVIYEIIRRRRASGTMSGDLLSVLLQAQDDEGLGMTDRQLHDEIMTLFLAGHETTANALSWTWLLLGQHPEVEEKLVEELQRVLGGRAPTASALPRLTYTEMVLREAMRLYPPVCSAPFRIFSVWRRTEGLHRGGIFDDGSSVTAGHDRAKIQAHACPWPDYREIAFGYAAPEKRDSCGPPPALAQNYFVKPISHFGLCVNLPGRTDTLVCPVRYR